MARKANHRMYHRKKKRIRGHDCTGVMCAAGASVAGIGVAAQSPAAAGDAAADTQTAWEMAEDTSVDTTGGGKNVLLREHAPKSVDSPGRPRHGRALQDEQDEPQQSLLDFQRGLCGSAGTEHREVL